MPVSRLILASRSPRRLELLVAAGFDVVQVDPPFADPPQPEQDGSGKAAVDPRTLAMDLAWRKAVSVRRMGGGRATIVAADTIVAASDGRLLGQPADRAEAARMLAMLMNATHQVISGVAVMAPADGRGERFADVAQVSFGSVPPTEIDRYLDADQWRGKAGAYNLAEVENRWPVRVQGDPTTVVGLPMRLLLAVLRTLGAGV